jgi:tetratricopeptide (TPR) repeat protein
MPIGGDSESPFEESVYEFIRSQGYNVKKQVGCAGFRVDMGIVDPIYGGKYLIGIECDGAKYHSCAVARDRDRLRQQILEQMGWKIYRVWSTDWYRNNYETKQRLLQAIKEIMIRVHGSDIIQNDQTYITKETTKNVNYYARAVELYQTKKIKDAIGDYRQALEVESEIQPHFELEQALVNDAILNNYIQDLMKFLSQKITYAESFYLIGNYFVNNDQINNGIEAFKTALSIKPSYTEAQSNLVNAYKNYVIQLKKTSLRDAISYNKKWIEFDTDNPEAHYELGNLYYDNSQYDEAIIEYNRVVNLDLNNTNARIKMENAKKQRDERLKLEKGTNRFCNDSTDLDYKEYSAKLKRSVL